MTVVLKFNETFSGVTPADASTTISELDTIDGSTSSTSGTYNAAFVRYQYADGDRESEMHFHLELTDADDADYPNVKDDLAAKVAGLTAVGLTAAEVEPKLNGTMT